MAGMAGIPAMPNPMRHRLEEQEAMQMHKDHHPQEALEGWALEAQGAMQMHKHYQEALEGWAWPDHLHQRVSGKPQELALHQHLQAA